MISHGSNGIVIEEEAVPSLNVSRGRVCVLNELATLSGPWRRRRRYLVATLACASLRGSQLTLEANRIATATV